VKRSICVCVSSHWSIVCQTADESVLCCARYLIHKLLCNARSAMIVFPVGATCFFCWYIFSKKNSDYCRVITRFYLEKDNFVPKKIIHQIIQTTSRSVSCTKTFGGQSPFKHWRNNTSRKVYVCIRTPELL
jgi:hypothetical protein